MAKQISGYGLPIGDMSLDPNTPLSVDSSMFSAAPYMPQIQRSQPAPQGPILAYDPGSDSYSINGVTVKSNDYAGLAQSPLALSNPPTPPSTPGDWRPVDPAFYQKLIKDIADPSLSTVALRNLQQAYYSMKQIGYGAAGAASDALGADSVKNWASAGAQQAGADVQRYSPFNYEFGFGPDDSNVKAFVGAVAQAAPWLAGSVVTGGTGGIVGRLAASGVVRSALEKVAANAALSEAEKVALVSAARQYASAMTTRGAIGGAVAGSYATGVGDVYNESVEAGNPDPAGAFIRGIPYAATDLAPEAAALSIGLGKAGPLTGWLSRRSRPSRMGLGLLGGGIAEGSNEAIQEQILVNQHDASQPGYADSPEAQSRILQAGLGGAAPGMLLGGLAGIPSHRNKFNQINVLDRKAFVENGGPDVFRSNRVTDVTNPSLPGHLPYSDVIDPTSPTFPNPSNPYNDVIDPTQPFPPDGGGPGGGGMPSVFRSNRPTNQQLELFDKTPNVFRSNRPNNAPVDNGPMPSVFRSNRPDNAPEQLDLFPLPAVFRYNRARPSPNTDLSQDQVPAQSLPQVLPALPQEITGVSDVAGVSENQGVDQPKTEKAKNSGARSLRRGIGAGAGVAPVQQTAPAETGQPVASSTPTKAKRLKKGVTSQSTGIPSTVSSGFTGVPNTVTAGNTGVSNAFSIQNTGVPDVITNGNTEEISNEIRPVQTGQQQGQSVSTVENTPVEQQTASAEASQHGERRQGEEGQRGLLTDNQSVQAEPSPPGNKVTALRWTVKEKKTKKAEAATETPSPKTEAMLSAPIPTEKVAPKAEKLKKGKVKAKIHKLKDTEPEERTKASQPFITDAHIESTFDNEPFTLYTYSEVNNAGDVQKQRWFASIQKAILQKPAMREAIKRYIDSLESGSFDKFSKWQEETETALTNRARVFETSKQEPVSGATIAKTNASSFTKEVVKVRTERSPAMKLADFIKDKFNSEPKDRFIAKIKALYASVSDKNMPIGDNKLSDYFTDGEPNVIRTNNRNILVPFHPKSESAEQFKLREKAIRDEIGLLDEEYEERDREEARRVANDIAADIASTEAEDFNSGERWNSAEYMSPTGKLTKGSSAGTIRLKIASILSKFKVVPHNIGVVQSAGDLPKYVRDAGNYTEEQLKRLAAVVFGNQVFIVADNIHTNRQLKTIVLHEVVGHFGLRALVPNREAFISLMHSIYDNDAVIRAEVERLGSGRYKEMNKERWQLVEEALSDMAGDLTSNWLSRIWNAIKKTVNSIFGTDFEVSEYSQAGPLTRALLAASNKYVREGVRKNQEGFKLSEFAADVAEYMHHPSPTAVHLSPGDAVGKFLTVGGFNTPKSLTPIGKALERGAKAFGVNSKHGLQGFMDGFTPVMNVARRNGGFRRVFETMQQQSRRIHELFNTYNEMTAILHKWSFDMEKQLTTGKMLTQTTRAKLTSLKDSDIDGLNLLIPTTGDNVGIDPVVLAKLKSMGRFTIKDFANGIEIEYTTDRAYTTEEVKKLESDRDREIKRIEDESNIRIAAATDDAVKVDISAQRKQDIKNVKEKYRRMLEDGYEEVTHKIKEAPINITSDSQEWIAYNKARDALDQAQLDMLLAKYNAHKGEARTVRSHAINRLGNSRSEKTVITEFASNVADTYRMMMRVGMTIDNESSRIVFNPESVAKANTMLDTMGRALFKDEGVNDLYKSNNFTKEQVDKLVEQIKEIRKLNDDARGYEGRVWDFIAGLRTEFTELLGMEEAEMYAKRSIAGGHTPLRRHGDHEVVIQLHDKNGNIVIPSENWDNQLMYMRFENPGDAENTAKDINEALNGTTFTVMAVDKDGNTLGNVSVSPSAFARVAETVAPLGHKISLYDFMTVADRLGVHLTPNERERVIKALTRADAKARRSLKRGGNPGEDKDVVRAVSEQLESVAHIVAAKENKRLIDNLMVDDKVWFGDQEAYQKLKADYQAAVEGKNSKLAQRLLRSIEEFEFEYKDAAKNARYYKALASGLRDWQESQRNLINGEEGKILSELRTLVSTSQLGGHIFNIASAAMQVFSIPMHSMTYLMGYNSKTAFGGGFGFRAPGAIAKAIADFGNPRLGDLAVLEEKLKTLNIPNIEKKFLLTETKEGVFQAAAFNALLGSARGRWRYGGSANAISVGIKKWMQFFSQTEELNRRVTGMAAFRLYYDRAISEGLSKEEAYNVAASEARKSVYYTQGDYSMSNRPIWARQGLASLLFMYKMYPLVTVNLINNMPRSQKLMFLGMLVLFGGLKAIPFSEDMFDLIDGFSQRTRIGLGITRGNVELAIRDFADTFFPGGSDVLMRGALDAVLGLSISSRVGVGDIIPGTGFARAGSDIGNVAQELQGPAGGFISSMYNVLSNAMRGNVEQAKRNIPVVAAKNVIEGSIYVGGGSIVNKSGKIIATDVTPTETVGRFMGFYPARQAVSNEFIENVKYSIDFNKEIKADYVSKYVRHMINGDTARAQEVISDVAEWNQSARGTELEISNFGRSASRALTEARRPQYKGFEKNAPVQIKRMKDHLESLYGVDIMQE